MTPQALAEPGYRERLRASPLRRAGRAGLARSAAIALGNTGGAGGVAPLTAALKDAEPQVRSHAAWGLGRCGGPDAQAALREASTRETDPGVRAAIDKALKARAAPRGDGDPCAKMTTIVEATHGAGSGAGWRS